MTKSENINPRGGERRRHHHLDPHNYSAPPNLLHPSRDGPTATITAHHPRVRPRAGGGRVVNLRALATTDVVASRCIPRADRTLVRAIVVRTDLFVDHYIEWEDGIGPVREEEEGHSRSELFQQQEGRRGKDGGEALPCSVAQ